MKRPWHAYYSDQVPHEIEVDQFANLNELFDSCCQKYADYPAFTNFGTQLSYKTLAKKSRQLASYFHQHLKLSSGERLAIMMPNLLQYPVVLFAALQAGLVIVNINPLYTAQEVRKVLLDAEVSVVVVLANFAKTLEQALVEKTKVRHILITELGDLLGLLKGGVINFWIKHIKKEVPRFSLPNSMMLSSALMIGSRLDYRSLTLTSTDAAFLQYTGGTTGTPKAAVLTHRNIVANILQNSAWVKPSIKPGHDHILGALPLYHIFSLTVCCLTCLQLGAACVLVTDPRNLNSLLRMLAKKPLSIFVGLNTLFAAIIQHPNFHKVDFSQIKLTVAGGMATQATVAEQWQRAAGVPILEGYGLTEASPVVSISPTNQTQFNGSVGVPLPSTDVKVIDDEGNTLSLGETGELCVRGPQVMQEYWQKPEETQAVLTSTGWLLTGDIARIDDNGFIYIVDRKKDMILVSGFSVYPNEIEAVLTAHPGIKEAAVIGVPHEKTGGEVVKAFIVKKDPALQESAIIDYCRLSLTRYKLPRLIEFCDALPKNNVGKVLRRNLREKG